MVYTGVRWIVFAAGALVLFFVLTGSSVVGSLPRLGDLAGADTGGRTQSGAQISAAEFASAPIGMTPSALRAFVGEPESRSADRIEGLRIECWYYGIGGTSGAYQLCFANGKLRSKLRFDP